MWERYAFRFLMIVLLVYGGIRLAHHDFDKSCLEIGRKQVLLIGDSISVGYDKEMPCQPDFAVMHNDQNARSTWYGRAMVHEWLAQKPHWDLIVFNFGVHDLHHRGLNGTVRSTPQEYKTNIRWMARRLKEAKTPLLFLTSTPVPGEPLIERYNAIAVQVMKDEGIPVFDLYEVAKPLDHLREKIDGALDTHFTPEGYRALSGPVADAIRARLAKSK